ncbi:meiosis inhibitor protein 1 isoform 4-T4 [Liasis olivaceus]
MASFVSEPLVCEQFHSRHDPHWLLEFMPSPLCLACAIETLKEGGVSLVRKKHMVSCLRDVLIQHATQVVPLFVQNERVCAYFIATLFGILQVVEDSSILDLLIEVLVQLVVELKLDRYLHYLLDECQKELCKIATTRNSLPVFILLGKLANVIPSFADTLVTEHSLLKQLLKYDNFVSVIMSFTGKGADPASPELFEGDSLLPLILKKLLLSRDEVLQVASTQCMAAILVHSPAKYAPAFIHADIPEFLFECLFCMNEILIWSVYCCLLLLTEEQLFFSKCHTVYGIEPLIKSLKETLHLNNTELQKQGLLLFIEILNKQPVEIKLFTNIAVLKDAVSILLEAVKCPAIEVAAEAVKAVTAILRKDHVSFPPIQYGQLQKLIETILMRCNDLPLAPFSKRLMDHQGGRCKNRAVSQQAQFLQSALESFRNACSLAVQYQKDPLAQENTFTAPNSENIDTLKGFSEFLLRISDSLCIPMVMKYSERAVHPGVMEVFLSTLSILFNVMPDMRKRFSIKMVSSSFIQLNLELKAKFCTGQSNAALNQACCSFLHSVCLSLHLSSEKVVDSSQQKQEISALLWNTLPQLNFSAVESLRLLSETLDPLCLNETLRNQQYSLLFLFYLAFSHEDRFVPETELFSAISSFLLSVKDQGDCPPPYIVKAILYLLAICQHKSKALDLASLSAIRKILDVISDFSLVYVHHPLVLKFFLQYPDLMGRFGHCILQLWFSCEDFSQIEYEDAATKGSVGFPDSSNNFNSLLCMLKDNPSAILVLLDLVCFGTNEVAHKVLISLKTFLRIAEDIHICDLLRSQFLQILQQLLVENNSSISQVCQNLPLLLNLLFLVQLRYATERELDNTDLRLLRLVINLSGKCSPTDSEILQPSLNFLYWSLQQTIPSSQQIVVVLLLSNTSLLELLEKVLHCTWMATSFSEPVFSSSIESLLCSAWLLTASLLTQQNIYSTEVHHMIYLDVDKVFSAVAFRKKCILFFVSILQFLRAFFKQNLCSSFVKFTVQSAGEQEKELPWSKENASLYPLAMWHVLSLVARLQNLLVQKDILLSRAVIGCLEVLLGYLHMKNQSTACHIASHPWNKFLLITLLDGNENSFLNSEILRLIGLVNASTPIGYFVQWQECPLCSVTGCCPTWPFCLGCWNAYPLLKRPSQSESVKGLR